VPERCNLPARVRFPDYRRLIETSGMTPPVTIELKEAYMTSADGLKQYHFMPLNIPNSAGIGTRCDDACGTEGSGDHA
jgi:hypothetical protein